MDTFPEKSFTDEFLEYTKHLESPESFFRWSSYSMISAVLRDNAFLMLDNGAKLFLNFYIVLLAESGTYRKGRGVQLCYDFVSEVGNTKMFSGRLSVQGLITDLNGKFTAPASGKVLTDGSGIVCCEELASSFVLDASTIGILTDMYDTRKSWTYNLKSVGRTEIKSLCLSMFGASNPQFLKSVFTQDAVYGGLLGRTLFIVPNESRPPNSLMSGKYVTNDHKHLIDKLKAIAGLKGEIKRDVGAGAFYDEWYNDYCRSKERLYRGDKTGFLSRLGHHVLKLACIISIGKYNELILKKDAIEEAIEQCIQLIPNYSSFAMNAGNSTIKECANILLEFLSTRASDNYSASKKLVLSKFFTDFDSEMLDKTVITLENAGLLSTRIDNSTTTYSLTPVCIQRFEGLKKENK